MDEGKNLEIHQILEKLESKLPKQRMALFRGCFLGVLSEVNYFLNEIFWTFFSRAKRRREFLEAIDNRPERITEDKGFWLDKPREGRMTRKSLDCLGKRNFPECLKIYFEVCPHKKELFNEHLRMRFLIFYENTEDFLKAVEQISALRNSLAHPDDTNNILSGKELKLALHSLCYLVHPVFFGLLKGKARTLTKGGDFENSVNEVFEKIQKERKKSVKSERKRFFGNYKTRKSKGRTVTRSWSKFKERWEERKEEWQSEYRLHNFIYQFQRINPESLKLFANQCAPQLTPSFRDIEEIHSLLSALDLLLWEYVQQCSGSDAGTTKLRNCLAHNEKVGASGSRCLKREFTVLLNRLNPVLANNFYTQAESMLKKRNHRIDRETKSKVRYKKGEIYRKEILENPKLLRRVAASIKRDLKEAKNRKAGFDSNSIL